MDDDHDVGKCRNQGAGFREKLKSDQVGGEWFLPRGPGEKEE